MVQAPLPGEDEAAFAARYRAAASARWGEERAAIDSAMIERFARAVWTVSKIDLTPEEPIGLWEPGQAPAVEHPEP